MRAIVVAVDYTDLLSVTLPYNRHHFTDYVLVTSSADHRNLLPLAMRYDCRVVVTDLFYERGAKFNKWAALEHGLDVMGREGWLCHLDADVLWPKRGLMAGIPDQPNHCRETWSEELAWRDETLLRPGCLYSPLRRMAPWPLPMLPDQACPECNGEGKQETTSPANIAYRTYRPCPARCQRSTPPPESEWGRWPIHRNVGEWAGYTQIFHASDPVLGPPPWHDVNYEHAGTSDSLFQRRWAPANKVRPPWEVLHLGEPGQNWYGRATPYADGSTHPETAERRAACRRIWERRRELERQGLRGDDRFRGERLG